jgi:cytochrome c oxidase assembly factor CtaG
MTTMSIGVHFAHMAAAGLLVAVVAPAVLRVALVLAPDLDRATPHPAVALGGFVLLHAVLSLSSSGAGSVGPGADLVVLLLGALVFWAPVLGRRRRLSDPARVLYLFTAMPLLDLAGVWMVARGDSAGGLAMIVGMLPMAGYTVALTWRWVTTEERDAVRAESLATRTGLDGNR